METCGLQENVLTEVLDERLQRYLKLEREAGHLQGCRYDASKWWVFLSTLPGLNIGLLIIQSVIRQQRLLSHRVSEVLVLVHFDCSTVRRCKRVTSFCYFVWFRQVWSPVWGNVTSRSRSSPIWTAYPTTGGCSERRNERTNEIANKQMKGNNNLASYRLEELHKGNANLVLSNGKDDW